MATVSELLSVEDIERYKAPSEGLNDELKNLYSAIIPFAIAYIDGRLGFNTKETEYSHWLIAKSKTILCLKAYPVSELKLVIDGKECNVCSETSAEGSVNGAFAYLNPNDGTVTPMRGYFFPLGAGRIYAQYTAGWGSDEHPYPQDLVLAGILITLLIAEERTRIGVRSKTIGAETISQYIRESKDYETLIESAIMRHTRF